MTHFVAMDFNPLENKENIIKMSKGNTNASSIVSKVWAFCQTLRDDGVGYGDYSV